MSTRRKASTRTSALARTGFADTIAGFPKDCMALWGDYSQAMISGLTHFAVTASQPYGLGSADLGERRRAEESDLCRGKRDCHHGAVGRKFHTANCRPQPGNGVSIAINSRPVWTCQSFNVLLSVAGDQRAAIGRKGQVRDCHGMTGQQPI